MKSVMWFGVALLGIANGDVCAEVGRVSADFGGLSGGTVSSEVIDVTKIPDLSLPLSEYEKILARELNPGLLNSPNDKNGDFTPKASTGVTCVGPTPQVPPAGWTITYTNHVPQCSYPNTSGYYQICLPGGYCYNQYNYTSFYDIPVGQTLRYCSVAGVPSGWQVTQTGLPSSCGSSGSDNVMLHVSCIAGRDTNCYPQSSSINASPQVVIVPYGKIEASTTISWNTSGYSTPCIWAKNSGGSNSLWACDGSGAHSRVWNWVPSGGTTTFWISSGGSSSPSPNVRQVIVTGQPGTAPTISASPTVVNIPPGQQNGSTTVSYNLAGSGYNEMCIWISSNGGSPSLWSCNSGTTHSQVWPYVPKGGTTEFGLSTSSSSYIHLAPTIIVYGN